MARRPSQRLGKHDLPKQDRGTKASNMSEEEEEGGSMMNMLHKLMLSASFWGNEASCDFGQLYTVPILQTLGLPMTLATLTGVVSGPSATILIPFLGWWTDQGPNPTHRKTMATILVCLTSLLGMICIILANLLHLNTLVDKHLANGTAQDTVSSNVSAAASVGEVSFNLSEEWVVSPTEYVADMSERISDLSEWGLQGSTTGDPVLSSTAAVVGEESSEVPFKAMLGLLGFIILDIGFDASNSCIKSLVLTCCPYSEHTSLLVIGLIMASVGGVSTAALGLLDFSSMLGLNYIEGGSLTIQTTIQAMVIIVFLVVGLPISLLTVHRFLKLRRSSCEETACISKPPDSHPPVVDEVCLQPEEQFSRSVILDAFEHSIRSYGGGGIHFDQSLALLDERQRRHSFGDHHSYHHASTEHAPLLGSQKVWKEGAEELERSRRISISVSYKRRDSLSSIPEHLETRKASLRDVPENQLVENYQEHTPDENLTEAQSGPCQRNFKVKVFLVTLATYFSSSDLFLFTMTSSDFVGKAIFGGDPTAPPGSQLLTNYQDGVKMASVGFLIYYIAFLVFSFIQTRLLHVIGYRAEFVTVHLLMSVALMALSLTEMMGVFFALTVVAGMHRVCIYSVPFAAINDLVQSRDQERQDGKTNVGFAISMVSASLPLSYCTLFSWIGPLEDLTGMVAVPFWTGAVTALLSASAFLAVGKV